MSFQGTSELEYLGKQRNLVSLLGLSLDQWLQAAHSLLPFAFTHCKPRMLLI